MLRSTIDSKRWTHSKMSRSQEVITMQLAKAIVATDPVARNESKEQRQLRARRAEEETMMILTQGPSQSN